MMRALNATSLYKDLQMIPLWKTLTLMKPAQTKDFDPDAIAGCSITYEDKDHTEMTCTIHILGELIRAIAEEGDETDADGAAISHWTAAWNMQMYGVTMVEDQLESEAKNQMSVDSTHHTAPPGLTGSKGKGKGKSKSKHWAAALVHVDYANPFPIKVNWKIYLDDDYIPYNWNDYCQKMNQPDQKVDDKHAITTKGKPTPF